MTSHMTSKCHVFSLGLSKSYSNFIGIVFKVFEVKKFNGIISKNVRSALDTVTSRDDVTHDVKVSCIFSLAVGRTTILVSIWGFSRSRNAME